MICILENWSFGLPDNFVEERKYLPPELWDLRIMGSTVGHKNRPDGTNIAISAPIFYDPEDRVIKTFSGSYYKLGNPAPSYLEEHPDCVEKMHKKLSELPKELAL